MAILALNIFLEEIEFLILHQKSSKWRGWRCLLRKDSKIAMYQHDGIPTGKHLKPLLSENDQENDRWYILRSLLIHVTEARYSFQSTSSLARSYHWFRIVVSHNSWRTLHDGDVYKRTPVMCGGLALKIVNITRPK